MIPLHTTFFVMVGIFIFIGSMRGWAKEILTAVSVVLALFVEAVLTTLVPPIQDLWNNLQPMAQFWIRLIVFGVIVIFGYASPALAMRAGAKVARERLEDLLLGFFLGLLNGILIVGSLWFFLDEAHYGVPPDGWRQEQARVQRVDSQGEPLFDEAGNPVMEMLFDDAGQPVFEVVYDDDARGLGGIRPPRRGSAASNLLPYLPPRLIKGPPLYVAVALAFVFVIIVFV